MAVDVLQTFLTKRLFDVGADDNRVTSLRETAADLAAVIKAAPQRTATFTMVAIDSAIGPDEPLVGEVMSILVKRWNSYAGAFTDAKLPTVARAIILHALSAAMGSEPIAAAVSLTARSMLPRLGDVGDRALWSEIIGDADRRLDQRAAREWALPSSATAAETTIAMADVPALAAPNAPKQWLTKQLEAASGPSNAQGETLENANQSTPNQGPAWSHVFAPKAATAIAAAINHATEALVKSLNEREGAQELRTAVSDYVTATSSALIKTALGLERRTALLWWKEALYSPAAQASYRGLDPAVAAALAAVDASRQTGAFAPRMAEAMVRETLRSIDSGAMAAERPLIDHVTTIAAATDKVRAALDQSYQAIHSEPGRTPLGALLADEAAGTPAAYPARLGLPADMPISAIDLGVWLFRDLQAAAATPAPVKRKRGGKGA